MEERVVAVVPFSSEYGGGRLFELQGQLNRDNALLPWSRLASELETRGFRVATHDQLGSRCPIAWLHLDCFRPPPADATPGQTVLLLIEPEVVAPYWYRRFDKEPVPWGAVLTHCRALVQRGLPFQYLHFPQSVERSSSNADRDLGLVMINGRKYAARRRKSLYGAREQVAAWFARRGRIAVFGPGWGTIDCRHPVSGWRNLAIRAAAKGRVHSKLDVLSRADFVLCFENMISAGYHTEKLFDVFAAGAIPIYWGDPEISSLVPGSAFIDYARLRRPRRLLAAMESLGPNEQALMRTTAQEFLDSSAFAPYLPDQFARTVAEVIESVAR